MSSSVVTQDRTAATPPVAARKNRPIYSFTHPAWRFVGTSRPRRIGLARHAVSRSATTSPPPRAQQRNVNRRSLQAPQPGAQRKWDIGARTQARASRFPIYLPRQSHFLHIGHFFIPPLITGRPLSPLAHNWRALYHMYKNRTKRYSTTKKMYKNRRAPGDHHSSSQVAEGYEQAASSSNNSGQPASYTLSSSCHVEMYDIRQHRARVNLVVARATFGSRRSSVRQLPISWWWLSNGKASSSSRKRRASFRAGGA